MCDMMTMTNSEARSINIDIPRYLIIYPYTFLYINNGFTILSSQPGSIIEAKELCPQDAVLVAKRWKFASPGSDIFLAETIQHGSGSAGVYLNGELVSWVVIFIIGSINALYTEDNYRGQGFGLLTMKKVCKIGGDKGLVPNVQIQIGNIASKKLMSKIGFKDSHVVEWVIYRPK
jgi:GNAT superfamily N-acetyltransferase